MKLKVTLMLLLALTVTACQKNERTATTPMTGVYGAAMISGEVQMADGSSPAGVEVTLRGTGMTTVLAADGRFAFGSVPSDGELAFRRASDGVDAALRVGNTSGHMTIELAKSDARRSGRRRGVGRGEKVREIEGLVVSADAAQLVVFSSKKEEVTVALTPATVIRHGGTILSAADLTPDTRVHVKAKLVDEVLTAIQVIVQNDEEDDEGDDEDRPRKEFEGLVLSTTEAQLVMVDAHGDQVTFNITPATTIRKGNTPVLLSEIEAGWRVHVRTAGTPALADGTFDALLVIVQNTNDDDDDDGEDDGDSLEVKIGGKIASVGGAELVVRTDDGDVTVQTDASTQIVKGGSAATLADLAVGDKVKVEGVKVSDGVVLAREIEVKR